MQAHKEVAGIPIGTTLLKIGRIVFEKNLNFPKRLKKKIKKPDPNNIFIIPVFITVIRHKKPIIVFFKNRCKKNLMN